MNPEEMKKRTKQFALSIIKLIEELPKAKAANTISGQLLRCSTSVGANYRAACRARSKPDFIYRMKVVEEEADESIYWLEILEDSGIVKRGTVAELIDEADQFVAISVSSIKTAKKNKP